MRGRSRGDGREMSEEGRQADGWGFLRGRGEKTRRRERVAGKNVLMGLKWM